jgi:protein gp37
MGEKTGISWTNRTFNPWFGCQRISPACGGSKGEGGCYAEALVVGRMGYNLDATVEKKRLRVWGPPATSSRVRTSVANWRKPIAWNKEAKKNGTRDRVFCASLADVFEAHPDLDAVRADLWPMIEACESLDWQLLTKRPENIRAMVPPAWLTAWPEHVWIGTTVESQKYAEKRIPELLAVPARVRFLSCEPLLEAVSLDLRARSFDGGCRNGCLESSDYASGDGAMRCFDCQHPTTVFNARISWVIVGGESGTGARPFDIAWARGIVAQCREAGVPVFVKQMGDNPVENGVAIKSRFKAHHGADPNEWPEDLRVQEFPEVAP